MNNQRNPITLYVILIVIFFFGGVSYSYGQVDPETPADCSKIAPRGGNKSDAKAMRSCLCTQNKAILTAGQFLINSPIVFPSKAKNPDPANCTFQQVSGAILAGQGAATVLNIKASCSAPFQSSGSPPAYDPVIDAEKTQATVIKDLTINLSGIPQNCNLAIHGGFAVKLFASPGSTVSGLVIKGDMTTTGGANAGAINVINSPGAQILGNTIKDLGYTLEQGGTSSGTSAIRIDNSATSTIDHNSIARVAFGIQVNNQIVSDASGYAGDSSGTVITNNSIIGASQIYPCKPTGCAQGRAIKLEAFDVNAPLKNLRVESNTARDFGGKRVTPNGNLTVDGSGLDVIGALNSTFTNNTIDGFGDSKSGLGGSNSAAEFGLQLRNFPFPNGSGQTSRNTFNGNFFRSGYLKAPCPSDPNNCDKSLRCTAGCADVNFNNQPDQTGLSQSDKGTNDFRNYRP